MPNNPLRLLLCSFGVLLSGCTAVGKIENAPLKPDQTIQIENNTLFSAARNLDDKGLTLMLTFSGGGTRASALAYGVMEELRDTSIIVNGENKRMLDEVDFISSVSGGSFTAAYYGLHREKLFTDFKKDMLTRSLSSQILHTVFNPFMWFSSSGRTDYAAEVFAEAGFGDATFADMFAKGDPVIAINATDLSKGIRFTFLQDYFNLLCSDLSSFPVSRAVTASAAVPVLFDPVVIENYSGCDPSGMNQYLQSRAAEGSMTLLDSANAALSYSDKSSRPFIHLVDGGIADNLGLRTLIDTVEFAGGMKNYLEMAHQGKSFNSAKHFIIIVVNASVKADTDIDTKTSPPSITQTINAVTDAQLHLYNNETLDLAQSLLDDWSIQMSTPERPVKGHLILVDLKSIKQPALAKQVNHIPTTLGLPEKEINLLIELGRSLLRNNEEFISLKKDLAISPSSMQEN